MKRWIVTFGLLMLMMVPVVAQEATPEAVAQQEWILDMVERVEVVEQDGHPVLLIGGTLKNTCEAIDRTEVERRGVALFVDLYRTLNPAIRCFAPETPFEITVVVDELLALDENMTLPQYLIVNDRYYRLALAQIEPVGTPPAVPPVLLTAVARADLPVDNIAIAVQSDGFYGLTVTGQIGDGCTEPVIVRARRVVQSNTQFFVDAFRLIDQPENCPTVYVAIPFELTLTTDQLVTMPIIVIAGEKRYMSRPVHDLSTPEPRPSGNTFRSLHGINSVEIRVLESAPPQYGVHVTGYQPDGCTFPIQISQTRSGSTISIQIFREMPIDVMCPMMIMEYSADIRLEGDFAAGAYTVEVNGTTATFEVR